MPFLLEYDTASQRLTKLTDKLDAYWEFQGAVGHPTWLFRFPTPGREAAARQAISRTPLPIATAVLPDRTDPTGPAWLPLGSTGPRRTLNSLGAARDRGFAAPDG